MDILPQICWRTKYAAAFMQEERMVIRYRFPFSREREANLLGAYAIEPDERMGYYNTLGAMMERNASLTAYLKAQEVPSILYYDEITQKKEDNGIICIYCSLPQPVVPITQAIFDKDFNALTAVDVFWRLSVTLRDISKTPAAPVLRYLDLEDVYLTNDNKILLGGFFYHYMDDTDMFPPFLADASRNLPACILDGAIGDAGTDIQTLCMIAWNIFSGLPWDCVQTKASLVVPPQYAPPELVEVLQLGLQGDPQSQTAFRKQLVQCRKALSKTAFAEMTIPAPLPYKKEYRYRVAASQQEPNSGNGANH